MPNEHRTDDQAKCDVSRRQFVVGTTCVAGALSAPSIVWAAAETSPAPAATVPPKPVAYVWMGQILFDATGQEKPYVPPAAYRP